MNKPTTDVKPNEGTARGRVAERDQRCAIRSPWCQGTPLQFGHRIAKGQGGLWLASNGILVCGLGNASGCHGYAHQHPELAKFFGWIVVPEPGLNPAHVPTLIHNATLRHSWILLDDHGMVRDAPACTCPTPDLEHGGVWADTACMVHGQGETATTLLQRGRCVCGERSAIGFWCPIHGIHRREAA